LALAIPATAGVRRVRFTSTGDESCSPGLAELEVIGFYGDDEGDEVTEGGTLDLLARFFDTDPTEMHTATVDWGDGEAASVPGSKTGGNGPAEGSHVYLDDGQYTVEVCVTDTAGNTGCDTLALTVVNAAPVINQRDIDLRTWQVEAWADDVHPNTPNWVIEDDGKSAIQTVNAPSSVLLSDFPAFDTRITGSIEVETATDDDFIGFVLGYNPGDMPTTDGGVINPDSDFLLLRWKQAEQDGTPPGMALYRVLAGSRTEIARAINLGDVGWQDFQEYHFAFELNAYRLRLFVDGVLEFDLAGEFDGGRLGFYNHSQERVRYRAFEIESLVLDEGQTVAFQASFSDPGSLDTHAATVDWRDGTLPSAGAVTTSGATGFVNADHPYLDDGLFDAELCVTDDDGAVDCELFPILVRNVAPAVEAGPDAGVGAGLPFALDQATYADPGSLDTHTATVDWGDGTSEPA
ncbi:MAG: hypothetical protein GY716_13105, partial [bacterium]|nr:hypothetical protein [bacterium]